MECTTVVSCIIKNIYANSTRLQFHAVYKRITKKIYFIAFDLGVLITENM